MKRDQMKGKGESEGVMRDSLLCAEVKRSRTDHTTLFPHSVPRITQNGNRQMSFFFSPNFLSFFVLT